MDFTSKQFITFILITLISYFTLPKKYWNSWAIGLLNTLFIISFIKTPYEAIPFVIFLALSFCSIKYIEKYKSKKSLIILLFSLIFIFIYLKKYSFISFIPLIKNSYMSIGLSYILFRVIHLIIDIKENTIKKKLSFLSFFNYSCFFLSFTSGPIQQYQDFQNELSKEKSIDIEKIFKSLTRIADGYIKILILSPLFHLIYANNFTTFQSNTEKSFVFFLACINYLLYIYFNFSGYMNIVIGIGNILNIDLPENFNKPFNSTSLLEFWSRWHITLSLWFKQYVFNPLTKKFILINDSQKLLPFYGCISYLFTFFIVGVWHGSTLPALIYGLLLGGGVSLNKLYEIIVRKYIGKKKYKSLHNNYIFKNFSCGLTLSYMSISISCLFLSINEITDIAKILSIKDIIFIFFSGGIFISCIKIIVDIIYKIRIPKLIYPINLPSTSLRSMLFFIINLIIIAASLIIISYDTPKFIYQIF